MEFSRTERIGLVVLFLLTLSGLLLIGGIDRPPAPDLGVYPGAEDIAQQPQTYHDQHVSYSGQVVSTDPITVRAEYDTPTGIESIGIEVTDVDATVARGDRLQVFGVLTAPRTVWATNVVVVPESGLWYAWVISFVAGLWVLVRILRHWRVDIETGAVRPRSDVLRGGDE